MPEETETLPAVTWRTPNSWDEADAAFGAGVCQQKGVDGEWFRIQAASSDWWNSPSYEHKEYDTGLDQFRIPVAWTMKDNESNEVPTCQPPEGVHGPTLGRDLPDGCERVLASHDPAKAGWATGQVEQCYQGLFYWWRFPPLKVGDRVTLTGVVMDLSTTGRVFVNAGHDGVWINTAALTRVVTP